MPVATQHDLEKVHRWAPAHPHLPRWRAECRCWWVGPWCPTAREAVDSYDNHLAAAIVRAEGR